MTLRIAHLFADHGVEGEALASYGDVYRYTIDPRPNRHDRRAIEMDLMDQMPDGHYHLAVLHPLCTDESDMTSISGDTDDHVNQIPRAREIAETIADHYIIENKPRDDLRDPTVLTGKMFGLPIEYKRAFETSFRVPQPPHHQPLDTETGPFFYSERTHRWWKSIKSIRGDYPKEHVAKNALPLQYVDYLARAWLDSIGLAEGIRDYSDYDDEMDERRAREANHGLTEFVATDGGSENAEASDGVDE